MHLQMEKLLCQGFQALRNLIVFWNECFFLTGLAGSS
jgi:hypothetical protein